MCYAVMMLYVLLYNMFIYIYVNIHHDAFGCNLCFLADQAVLGVKTLVCPETVLKHYFAMERIGPSEFGVTYRHIKICLSFCCSYIGVE